MSLNLPATVTLSHASAVLEGLRDALPQDGQGPLVVNASALKSLDSSCIAVLLECRRWAQQQGRAFQVKGWPAQLKALAVMYGVADLLAFNQE